MKYLLSFITIFFISNNVLSTNLDDLDDIMSRTNLIKQTKDVLDSNNKCFNKIVTKCADGFKISSNNLSCEIKKCETLHSAKSFDNGVFYNSKMKCHEPKITTCNTGYELKDNKCNKNICSKQPSLSNSKSTQANFLFQKEKCFIATLPTECESGYTLENKETDSANCEKEKVVDPIEACKRQPSLKHSIKTEKDFSYKSKNCTISELPIECESGYALYKPETDRTMCKKQSKGSRRN